MKFGPGYSCIILRPRPGYVPKVCTTPFRVQVVHLEEAEPVIAVSCSHSVRFSEQLFICFGGWQNGSDIWKQKLTHWIVDAIALVYHTQGEL